MGAPDITADAQQVLSVLKAGGVGLLPSDVGYAFVAVSSEALEKIFVAKKRGAHKRHPTMGPLELQREIHIMTPQQHQIIKTITQDFGIPIAVIGKYNPDHPVLKNLDQDRMEASSVGGTLHMAIKSGPLPDELARLASAENLLLQGSSANPSGTGNRYRIEDIPDEIKDIADIVIDYGLAKYSVHGLGSTILDFSTPTLEVVRVGACYETIRDLLKRFWGIEIPPDPGRAVAPHGNVKDLPPSESLKKLIEKASTVA